MADEVDDERDRMLPSDRQMYLDYAFQQLSREEMVKQLEEWDPKLIELTRSAKKD